MLRISRHVFLLTLVIFFCLTLPALAATRWVAGTQTQEIPCIKADPGRDRIYYGDATSNQVVVIDSNSEAIVKKIQVFGKPVMLDISKDGNTLAVASGSITLIDLGTYAVRELNVGKVVTDVAFDFAGQLYVSTSDGWGKIHKIDPATGATLRSFGTGVALVNSVYSNALVETDSSGRLLYVGERGLSPASLYKFDISGSDPIFLAEDDHGAIGSNLLDFAVHKNGQSVYLACGAPYEIQVISADTIDKVNSLYTGPYPNAVAIEPAGNYAYATADSQNLLFKLDLNTKVLVKSVPLLSLQYNDDPQARGVVVDRTGSKVFVVHGDIYSSSRHAQIQVATEVPLPDTDGDGVPDVSDNCPGDANADQSDSDQDGLGDICDPYPANPDNINACLDENGGLAENLLQLSADLTRQAESFQLLVEEREQLSASTLALIEERDRLAQDNQFLSTENMELRQFVTDADGDGIVDRYDSCPRTLAGAQVDVSGCSQMQFCASFLRPSVCAAADWKNDEPQRAKDCRWNKGACITR